MKSLPLMKPRPCLTRFGLMGLFAIQTLASPLWGHGPPEAMAEAATHFLAALDEAQREKATFEFGDEERVNWHFIPRSRKGLPLKEMRDDQRHLAFALLQSPLSHAGFTKSVTIMSLERVLHELENNSPRRDAALYFVSVFGTPSTNKTWAWRVEGHHLCLNFTLVDGQEITSTPSFFGTNPAEIREGPRKGLRVLAGEEDLARALLGSLTPDQQKKALIATEAPRDVISVPGFEAKSLHPLGLSAGDMNVRQVEILHELIKEYVHRLRPEMAEDELTRINRAEVRQIHFAWAGGLKKGEGHYYRVQGPTFVLEYDNTQNQANHAHAVWRDFDRDFGVNLLRAHYQRVPHGPGN